MCAGRACRQFVPPCGQQSRWQRVPGSSEAADVMGECSHNWIDGLIVDTVMVPANLAPGKYVLGWRWDAEQTSQVCRTLNPCNQIISKLKPPCSVGVVCMLGHRACGLKKDRNYLHKGR